MNVFDRGSLRSAPALDTVIPRADDTDPCDSLIEPTPAQLAFLIGAMQSGTGFEVQQVAVTLDPNVDVLRLRQCWAQALRRHPMLRASFVLSDDSAYQIKVENCVDLPFQIASANSIEEFLSRDRGAGLNPLAAPAFRVALVNASPEEVVMVFTHHHALLDGRSFRILIADVLSDYQGSRDDRGGLRPAFKDHSDALRRREMASDRRYFLEKLRGAEPCFLPRVRPFARAMQPRSEVRSRVRLPEGRPDIVGGRASVANVVQAAWALMLSRYARLSDVVFGVTRSGRYLVPGGDEIVGCLINTVPLRVSLRLEESCSQLCERLHVEGREVRPYEFASLSEIQGWLGSQQPIFNSLLMFERFDIEQELVREIGSDLVRRVQVHQQSSFPIVVAAYLSGSNLDLALEFDPGQWSTESMDTVVTRFGHILMQIVDRPDLPVRDLNWMLPGELERISIHSSGPLSPMPAPADSCAVTIATMAQRQPRAIAYIDSGNEPTTYIELIRLRDAYIDALAGMLPSGRVVVGVLADRSLDVLALQLACFASGWTLLPLDPAWPVARVRAVMQGANPSVIVADDCALVEALDLESRPLLAGGLRFAICSTSRSLDSLAEGPSPAYVLFTSGSSGAPKGVVISHSALAAHAAAVAHDFGIRGDDRVLQFAAPAFDVAFEESIPTLIAGGAIVERPVAVMEDLGALIEFIRSRSVSVLNVPSVFFHVLMEHVRETQQEIPDCVRLVVIGSDAPTGASVAAFLSAYPGKQLVNAYGPTESTITCTICDLSTLFGGKTDSVETPIGLPIGWNRVFVLDPGNSMCPELIPGEICISGPQLADGYLNDPERTATNFGVSPLDGRRMYRSGDLGRVRSDGLIEFLGRVDDQVKIRGVRVEPSEVEHALRCVDGVSDAVVVVRKSTLGNELVAFLVPRTAVALDVSTIRDALVSALPACFIPSEFRVCAELPLRSNGKVDRGVLTVIAGEHRHGSRSVEAPSGDVESIVLNVFCRLLGRDDLGVTDNFFEAGGHSLLAVRLLSELNKIAVQQLPLASVFAHPTVRELARLVGDRGSAHLPSVVPLNAAANHFRGLAAMDAQIPVPCFFVCGVHLYASVAQAMEVDRPVFGVFVDMEERILNGAGCEFTVQSLAHAYLEAIRAVQPAGPYVLGGASFGGIVAYELAQQLKNLGEPVQLLILLDTILPRAWRRRGLFGSLRQRLSRFTRRHLGDRFDRAFAARQSALTRGDLGTSSQLARLDRLRDRAFEGALERYDAEVRPYFGRAVIVRAARPFDDEHDIDWHLGWAGLVPHETPVFGVDGDHLGILVGSGASEIAAILDGKSPRTLTGGRHSLSVAGWIAALPSPACIDLLIGSPLI